MKRLAVVKVRPVTRALAQIPHAARLTERQQSIFVTRSGSLYRGMAARLQKTLGKDYKLPFSLLTLRLVTIDALNQPCRYCSKTVTTGNFSLDHIRPLSRGGSPDIENLEMTCKGCNIAKGELNADEFYALLQVLAGFDPLAAADVLGRMKAGAAVKRVSFLGRKLTAAI